MAERTFTPGQRVWVEPSGWWGTIHLQEGKFVRVKYQRGRWPVRTGYHTFRVTDVKTVDEHAEDLRMRRRLAAAVNRVRGR